MYSHEDECEVLWVKRNPGISCVTCLPLDKCTLPCDSCGISLFDLHVLDLSWRVFSLLLTRVNYYAFCIRPVTGLEKSALMSGFVFGFLLALHVWLLGIRGVGCCTCAREIEACFLSCSSGFDTPCHVTHMEEI